MKIYRIELKPDEDGVIRLELPADEFRDTDTVEVIVHSTGVTTPAETAPDRADDSEVPPGGTMARLIYEIEKAGGPWDDTEPLGTDDYDAYLDEHFADYLIERTNPPEDDYEPG